MSSSAPSSRSRPEAPEAPFRQGTVVAWNALAGTNQILIRGKVFTNLQSFVGSETGLIRVGDSVCVIRMNNTYAVLGRIEVPGVEQRALGVSFAQTVTLNAPTASAVFQRRNGPSVDVYIGSSRRAMVTLSAEISIANNVERMGFQVVGVSTISAVDWKCLTISSASSEFQASRILIVKDDDGLNEGVNTFQTMHKTGNHTSSVPLVGEVQITVQPF